ncbi:MAG: sensor domain-containing diguanylate cyclase [Eubacteriaceae bacterium]
MDTNYNVFFANKNINKDFSTLHQFLEKSKFGFVVINKNYRAIDANAQFAKMLGYTKDEVLQLHIWDWDAKLSKKDVENSIDVSNHLNTTIETLHRCKDGTLINVFLSSDVTTINGENIALCLCTDITERYQIERALRESEAKFKNFVENAHDLLFTVNTEYIITYFSPNVKNLYGVDMNFFIGKSYFDFLQEDDLLSVKNTFDQLFNGNKEHMISEFRVYDNEKKLHWFAGNFTLSKDEYNKPIIIGIARNIQEQKNYEEKLKFLSFNDPVTGLYNRAYFEDVIHRSENNHCFPITIFSLDIDGLKYINDTFGHHAGDQMIKSCGNLLKNIFRKEDILARIGGDEFIAILFNTDKETAKTIAKNITSYLDNQYTKSKIGVLKLSFGFFTGTDTSLSLIDIYKYADNNLIKIKKFKRKYLANR